MCGIVGFTGSDNCLDSMINLIKHRGPDSLGKYVTPEVSLGHARLSIIDTSKKGIQPMCNEDKKVWVSFNGEIYNYKELKKVLLKKGHKFKTKTDTEVLIHGYEEFGIEFLKQVNGMYGFALWDGNKKKLFLGRDPMGIKPLYYTLKNNEIYFASEIKALVQSGVIEPSLNNKSLGLFLFFRYVPSSETLFRSILKLLPGEIIEFSNNSLSFLDFGLNQPPNSVVKDFESVKESLVSKFEQSIKYRLQSDVPVSVFLSGGIDSSLITKYAQKATKKPLTAFSVEFDTNNFETKSEVKNAKKFCENINLKHKKLLVKEKQVIKKLPLIAWHYDEPIGDAAVIPTFFISKLAKKHSSVVLAGEGGDELFAGYTKYKKFLEIGPNFQKELMYYMKQHISVFNINDINDVLRFLKSGNNHGIIEAIISKSINKNNFLNNILYFDQKTMLAENYLMKADKMSMAHGLEERVPFLDLNMVNYANTISPDLKIKEGVEKSVLREVFKKQLPKEVVNRPKQGYGTPTKEWFCGELGKVFEERINKSIFFKHYLRKNYIKRLYRNHIAGKENNNTKLWMLLSLDLWYEIYFLKREVRPKFSYDEL